MDEPRQRPACLLIVDDDPTVATCVERVARRAVPADLLPAIVKAESPTKALEALARHGGGPVAVISDFNMGTPVNGIQLLREVSARRPGSRRVLMSAYPQSELAPDLEAAGLDAFVSKPFDFRALSDLLRRLVGEDGLPLREP